MTETNTNIKQGAVIGGWICFALGMLIMTWSLWLLPVYGALLFASFILSIIAMSQKRITGGVILLVACVTVAPGFWLYRTLTKSAHTLNKAADYIEQENRKTFSAAANNRQTPTRITTPSPYPGQPVTLSSATPTATIQQQAEASEIAEIYKDDLANADAASIGIIKSKIIDSKVNLENPRPCFSSDGKKILYSRQSDSGNTATLIVRALDTGNALRTFASSRQFNHGAWSFPTSPEIKNMAWSPDGSKALIVDSERNFYVIDLEHQSETRLPLPQSNITGDEQIVWKPNAVVFLGNESVYTLDLNDLRITTERLNRREDYGAQKLRIVRTDSDHQKCNVYRQQIQNRGTYVGDYLFISNKDFSYAHPLLKNFDKRSQCAPSPDLRHVAVSVDGQLTIYYLGVQKRPQISYSIQLDTTPLTNPENRQLYYKCLNSGVPFRATIYPPQINPLNGKAIGPNRGNPKGWVRITRWLSDSALLETCLEVETFSPGDVVSDIMSDSINENGYHCAHFGDEWRVLNPVPEAPTKAIVIGNRHYIGLPDETLHDPGRFDYVMREERQFTGILAPSHELPASTQANAFSQPTDTIAAKPIRLFNSRPTSLLGTLFEAVAESAAARQSPNVRPQTQSSYVQYRNTKYRFSAQVPATLAKIQESSSGDKATASSEDGQTKLLFLVKRNNQTIQQLYQEWTAEHTVRDPDKTVDYKVLRQDWFVVSGSDKTNDYYVKVAVRGPTAIFLCLEYPKDGGVFSKETLATLSKSFPGQ